MEETYAVGALAVIVAATQLLDFLKRRGIDLHKIAKSIDRLDRIKFESWYTSDLLLKQWHDHEDPDQPGVKIWWNQKHIADIIKQLADLQATQTALLTEMRNELKASSKVHEKILKKLDKK